MIHPDGETVYCLHFKGSSEYRIVDGLKYFDSITSGWIGYSHNPVLVKLFSHALVSSGAGHATALEKIKEDIVVLKQQAGLPT